jgi:hypothetical protein
VGGTDWGLPEIDVLETLVDTTSTRCTDGDGTTPCLSDGHLFDNVLSAAYWSATSDANFPAFALGVNFSNGNVSTKAKVNGTTRAWCAR